MQTVMVGIACFFLMVGPIACQLGGVLPPGCPDVDCYPPEPTCDIDSVGGALAVFAGKVVAPLPLNVSMYSFVGTLFFFFPLVSFSCPCFFPAVFFFGLWPSFLIFLSLSLLAILFLSPVPLCFCLSDLLLQRTPTALATSSRNWTLATSHVKSLRRHSSLISIEV
jgi:hypothetical protein